jgi:hypothetical protein
MKLQLDGQQLRLRLAEAEFAQLLQGTTVRSSTWLPGACWSISALASSDTLPGLDAGDEGLRLRLPLPLLLDYQQRLPCRDGIAFELPQADGRPLQVSVEVDVRASVRVRGVTRKAR